MANPHKPQSHLALKALPKPLLFVIESLFTNFSGNKIVLVGGTALSGFYFNHRRSDDIDLFTADSRQHKNAVQQVRSLKKLGVLTLEEEQFPQYYHSVNSYQSHHFTIDIVEDQNLFSIMTIEKLEKNIQIPDLRTLFKMKIATLISRCSEKDLFDLLYLMEHFSEITTSRLIEYGREIDSGVNIDALCMSIGGTILKKESCDFSNNPKISSAKIYSQIIDFQIKLLKQFINFKDKNSDLLLKDLLKKLL